MANKLAAVTGASSGIGYNLAKVFAENGYDLILGSAGPRLAEAQADFEALGVSVTAVQADLTTYEGCAEFGRALSTNGRTLDAIAINAGVGVGGLFVETDLDEEINLIRLNVESTVHMPSTP